MKISENIAEIVQYYLKDIKGIRLEWSFELGEGYLEKKPHLSIWAGYKCESLNCSIHERFYALLLELNCPDIILQRFESFDLIYYLGIRIPMNTNENTFYFHIYHYNTEKENDEMLSFKWKNNRLKRFISYKYINGTHPDVVLGKVHNKYKGVIKALVDQMVLPHPLSYWEQNCENSIQEIYFMFTWQPKLNYFLSKTREYLPDRERELLEPYEAYRFRSIGFSTANVSKPSMSPYFNAPIRQFWPNTLDEAVEEIRSSASEYHQLLESRYADLVR